MQPSSLASRPEEPSQQAYGRAAVRGAMWSVLGVATIQGLSLLSQLVLGHVLARAEVGIYAMAASFSGLVVILRNGGMHRILVQRPSEFGQRAASAFRIALSFNLSAAVIMVAAAPGVAAIYGEPRLVWMLAVIASALPLQSATVLHRSRLMVKLRYRVVSQLDAAAAAVRYGLMIVFALMGAGPMCFVLPLPIAALFEWISCRWYARREDGAEAERYDHQQTAKLLSSVPWVIFGSLTVALTMQSDKLVIGIVRSAEFLGVYFFGYQLSRGIARPFVSSLTQVLMPTLSHLSDDVDRQSRAYLKAVGALSFCTGAFGFGIAGLAAPVVHLLWHGKWDASVPVLQIFACGMPIMVVSAIATVLLESRARWRDVAWIQAGHGLLTAVAALAAAASGSLALTALSVVAVALLSAIVKSIYACRLVGISSAKLALAVVTNLSTPAVCILVSVSIGRAALDLGIWISMLLCAAIYVVLLLLACLTYLRQPASEVLTLLLKRRA